MKLSWLHEYIGKKCEFNYVFFFWSLLRTYESHISEVRRYLINSIFSRTYTVIIRPSTRTNKVGTNLSNFWFVKQNLEFVLYKL